MTVRDVEISALSARDEFISVARAAMAITAIVWIYLANNPFPAGGGSLLQRALLPYQKIVQSLPGEEQRMFRELQVSLLEAENIRSMEGQWPDAERLAADGIEPFAPNPTARGATYRWQLVRSGFFVNYLGVPDDETSPAWLVLVQEPDPKGPPELFQDDQEHHRLLDGTILHVSIWHHPDRKRFVPKAVQVPQNEGWIQLYAAAAPAATAGVESGSKDGERPLQVR
jgi:hypothetical protein